jgi:integrase
MRWRVGGRYVQEATSFATSAAGRKKAEALLMERTEINRLRDQRDRLQVLISRAQSIEQRIRDIQASASVRKAATLGELVELWRNSPRRRDCSSAQTERYAAQIGQFVAWAGEGVDVRAVDDDMAERYARHLAEHYSGNTYNKHLNTLDAAWAAVGRSAGTEANPWHDLPRKRLDTHVRRALTPEEIAAIRAAATGEDRALIEIGLRTGLRLGDACRLDWSAFRPNGVLDVVTGKTGAEVVLPSAGLLAALAEAGFARTASGPVLPRTAAAYKRDPSIVSGRIGRVFEAAGVARTVKADGWGRARAETGFHSLRHTFVTRAIEAGVPAPIVRALVGHASASMTTRYTHISETAILGAFKDFDFLQQPLTESRNK